MVKQVNQDNVKQKFGDLNAFLHEFNEEKPSGDYSTLIVILLSSGVLLCITIGFAVYAARQRRSYRNKRHQLTEELQTVENGYHDNPTLEVMEVQPEMQEKKANLNSDDGYIVPIDNLTKEELDGEEDTHL
ncbi:Podocalyxin [Acipenser ruthenus]|uniref:Podocalyxin n=1 Tax=Acipenser ruthenus TaxID=7906 RepID=A0A444U1B0_ACIRT|nr:Podocalyxin [Acipenser ruthenus]